MDGRAPRAEKEKSQEGEKIKKVKLKKIRTCVGCLNKSLGSCLLRVTKTNQGDIYFYYPDSKQLRAQGRSAYICPSLECIKKAAKRGGLSRTLKTKIGAEVYEALKNLIDSNKRSDANE